MSSIFSGRFIQCDVFHRVCKVPANSPVYAVEFWERGYQAPCSYLLVHRLILKLFLHNFENQIEGGMLIMVKDTTDEIFHFETTTYLKLMQ